MPPAFRLPLALVCAAACAALPSPAGSTAQQQSTAQSPAAFEALLARYDQASAADKDKLAAEVDAAAHQKYATVSRLYWYTKLTDAKTAAKASDKPILHLRMLGRLDEDLSCANSRLFRATLYSNQEVSAYLRDHFVLYWSSERPVPKVTIDYGDGRKIERTTTGNSAHYVMDADGYVLDVLPGLYAPATFRKELTEAVALAGTLHDKSDAERGKLVAAFQDATRKQALALENRGQIRRDGVEIPVTVTMRTVGKGAMEIPDLEKFAPETVEMAWSENAIATRVERARRVFDLDATRVLDASSLALVKQIYTAVPTILSSQERTGQMLARLQRAIVADTVLNEQDLRPTISAEIVRRGGRVDFETLNAFVYAKVFLTPATDAWLGLLPRTDFTGLPGDGVVMR